MGLYFRKSVRVGPLRFNFSKGGIGVSTGIPGFRIGTGPRGAYVHMGAGGLYYRQSLGGAAGARAGGGSLVPRPVPTVSQPEIPASSVGPMQDIESASVLEMTDTSAAALLEEIQRRQALPRLAPWVAAVAGLALLLAVGSGAGAAVFGILLAAGAAAFWWAATRDAMRRTVVIAYDLDPDAAARYEALIDSVKGLGTAGGLWHVGAEARVHDAKYHAGASSVVKRTATRPRVGPPPIIKTNLDVPSLNVGRQELFFFPDRLLVFEGAKVGGVSYASLEVAVGTTQFIEEGGVPGDAQVVGRTWRYVNKKGGPDKRFKDNRELPIALYETVHFRSTTGLNELLHVSRVGLGAHITHACTGLRSISRERVDPRASRERIEPAQR